MTKPKVTIAVVCLNEKDNITACLNSLLSQSYGLKNYQILVVDNNSTDGTQKIIKDFQKKAKNLDLVVNPRKGIAISRNLALKKTTTELLAFTDADAEAPKDWLEKLVKGFFKYQKKDFRVVAVGGGNKPPVKGQFYQALGLMLNTYLGSRGSVQAMSYLKDREVPHLPCVNVLYQKDRVKEVGGFDESLGSIIEDEDLSFRLRQKGFKLIYLTRAEVVHKIRPGFFAWARKMFIYGQGRIWFLQKYQIKSLIFALPVILVLTIPVSLPFYLIFISFYSLWLVLKAKKSYLFLFVWFLYFLTHYFYGLGEIYGLIKPYKKAD